MSTSMPRNLLRARDSATSWRAEDNPTLGKVHASVESPRSPDAGGSQAYSKPTLHKGGRSVTSDPDRHPGSLAALETTQLLPPVKQVGASLG
jgi:hypothetical protein